MQYTIKEINVSTGEELIRNATPEEIQYFEQIKTNGEIEAKVAADAQAARQALLAKLGITEEEAKLLLGGN